MSLSINGGNNDPRIGFSLNGGTKIDGAKGEVNVSQPIQITSTNSVTRTDLSSTISDISNRARLTSPSAQGLPAGEDVANGQLVSGYRFNSLDCDTRVFVLKYNSANAPQIANGTTLACDNIEYASVASHIQSSDSPFAELFS